MIIGAILLANMQAILYINNCQAAMEQPDEPEENNGRLQNRNLESGKR